MTSISDLPPELLSRICEFIPSQPSLAKLVRCSHQLYGVAAPHLYRSIELSRNPWKDELRHLEIITALLVRQPELGRSVQHLGIHENSRSSMHVPSAALAPEIEDVARQLSQQVGLASVESPDGPDRDCEPSPTESDEQVFEIGSEFEEEFLEVGSDADYSDWSTTEGSEEEDENSEIDIPTNVDGALRLARSSRSFREALTLAILVRSLPRLASIDLELLEPFQLRFIHYFIQTTVGSSMLRHVTSACYGSSRPERHLELWRNLFTLPELESVYLHRVLAMRNRETLKPATELQAHSLNITHLELRQCRISPFELRRILAAPKALKTFIYDIGEIISESEPIFLISYRSVREALEQQRDSLEQIWIDYPHDYEFDEWGAGNYTRPMGSLSGFKNLRRFRIASTYLFGFVSDTDPDRLRDSLPEQLEMLHLTHGDEDEEITVGLRKLLEAKQQGRFADLKELSVDVSIPWLIRYGNAPHADQSRYNKEVMVSLISMAEGAGIKMSIFNNASQSRTKDLLRRIQAARVGWTGPARGEAKWGFDGEFDWPRRMSGCMQKPDYPELKIDQSGAIQAIQVQRRDSTP
ncbi:hypothetical protein J7T55_013271 [Diaporthe amygdali]|uniref:uncharacterized protein n=1 Tax=Phomopsis amygdali TaxID=1214568 RepID=UPI0022FF1910|nr:uncharacterized protein J7T55_013271 [Diaporthe amygdali]KAJ0119036.1 hypothetical protein J7T55_013271 [Diaporthe amygdali]